jgi:hypothetical protein
MTMRNAVLGLAVGGLVLAGASPAQAVPEEAIASGSVGSVDAAYNGEPVASGPLAECASNGENAADSTGYKVRGFLEFGRGSSTCTLGDDGVAAAEVNGKLFRLDALRPSGGPLIRLTNYSAECATTENGSTASFHIGGLSGITVPAPLPPNYTATIPGRGPGAPALAKIVFNESIVPDPPDGSMTVNIMHVHLFPDGGSDTVGGEIVVGSVSCSPF